MIDLVHLMEVVLNTAWLLVAIGAFFFWRPEKYRGTPTNRGHGRSLGILALACALVLLFPVISLTDDLHAEQAAMEDSSRAVMKARNLVQASLRAGSSPFLAAAHAPFSDAALHMLSGVILQVETRLYCFTPISAHKGRSPPSNL